MLKLPWIFIVCVPSITASGSPGPFPTPLLKIWICMLSLKNIHALLFPDILNRHPRTYLVSPLHLCIKYIYYLTLKDTTSHAAWGIQEHNYCLILIGPELDRFNWIEPSLNWINLLCYFGIAPFSPNVPQKKFSQVHLSCSQARILARKIRYDPFPLDNIFLACAEKTFFGRFPKEKCSFWATWLGNWRQTPPGFGECPRHVSKVITPSPPCKNPDLLRCIRETRSVPPMLNFGELQCSQALVLVPCLPK